MGALPQLSPEGNTHQSSHIWAEWGTFCVLPMISESISMCIYKYISVLPPLYGLGHWSPTVSCELTGGTFQMVSMGFWSRAESSDWKGWHTMSENLYTWMNKCKHQWIRKEHSLVLELHRTPDGNACGVFYPPTAELPYIFSILTHGGWQWLNHISEMMAWSQWRL